jgi:hypothetical protein
MGETMDAAAPAVETAGDARVFYVTYMGDRRTVDGVVRETLPLATAFDRTFEPGDVIQFLAGTYWPPRDGANELPLVLRGLRGTADRPVIIRGLGRRTAISGADAAVPLYPALPTAADFAFFQFFDCEGVVVEDFQVSSCWPCFLYMENSRYVTMRGIEGVDSLYFAFARGQECHHICVEDCRWTQDPTGALWSEISWVDSHDMAYRFYNGALLGTDEVANGVVFRNNTITDCYNAIRLKARGAGGFDTQNRDVEISGNLFERVRDNPVEPEGNALNWWIHHNEIKDAYAWFSFDGVAGGYWAVFANKGWFTGKPGQPDDPNAGGRVFKYDPEGPYPSFPTEVFNNSWYLRTDVIKSGITRLFHHRNNAVQFCKPEQCETGVCDPSRNIVGTKFMPDGWDAALIFDYDRSNKVFPDLLVRNGQESHGSGDPAFHFRNAATGDLRVERPMAGTRIELTDWPCDNGWQPPHVDVGLYQGPQQAPLRGPAFAAVTPERPRVVRVDRDRGPGGGIAVWFSRPLAAGSVTVTLVPKHGAPVTVPATASGHRLAVPVHGPLEEAEVILLAALAGEDGQVVTSWAMPPEAGVRIEAA